MPIELDTPCEMCPTSDWFAVYDDPDMPNGVSVARVAFWARVKAEGDDRPYVTGFVAEDTVDPAEQAENFERFAHATEKHRCGLKFQQIFAQQQPG